MAGSLRGSCHFCKCVTLGYRSWMAMMGSLGDIYTCCCYWVWCWNKLMKFSVGGWKF